MAINKYESDDALLIQTEDGIVYFPGLAKSPFPHPLSSLNLKLVRTDNCNRWRARGMINDSAQASGTARVTSCPPNADQATTTSDTGCHIGDPQPMDAMDSIDWAERMDSIPL